MVNKPSEISEKIVVESGKSAKAVTEMPQEILDIQKATRQQIFDVIRFQGGQLPKEVQVTANLRDKKADETVNKVKDAAMKAREVVLEQKRLVKIIKDRFIQIKGNMPDYGFFLDEGTKDDLKVALESIIGVLQKPLKEIFKDGLNMEEYQEKLDSFLEYEMKEAVKGSDTRNQIITQIIDGEIDHALSLISASRKRPVLAHRVRGFHKDEASKEGLETAITKNVSEMEFDIRMSKDGLPIIHHNATLGASSSRPEAIKDLKYEELRQVGMKNGGHITSLGDFLKFVSESGNEATKINIDIKDFDKGMLDQILKLIHDYKLQHRVAIVSWFPQALQYMYEKDPTLSYSMSYYPSLSALSKWIFKKINRNSSGMLFGSILGKVGLGQIATWFAKRRAEAIAEGQPEVLTTGSEVITDAYALDPEAHYQDIVDFAEKQGLDVVGKHTAAFGGTPIEGEEGMKIMSKVLRNGSVNIQDIEGSLQSLVNKIPGIPGSVKKLIVKAIYKREKLHTFAQECQKNGVKVNLFDLKKEEEIAERFDSAEKKGIQMGVVYSSNPEAVTKLDTRDKTA